MPLPPSDEVHIWALDLSRPPGEVGGLLSSGDLRRAESILARRSEWVAGRAGLRALLGEYLGEEPASVRLRDDAGKKPRIEPRSPLRFNLSHSGDVALVAVATEREVGVDVEKVDRGRDTARLAARMMVASERAAIDESDDPVLAYYRHWVAKEAFAKATGRGMASMRSLEVALDGPGGPRMVQVGGDPREAHRWTLHVLEVAEPYVAALVVEGEATIGPLTVFEP